MKLKYLALWALLALGYSACTDSENTESTSAGSDSVLSPADSLKSMIQSLTQQIQMYPKNPALYIERSYLIYTSGDTRRAIDDIDMAIALNEKDPEAHYLRGFYELVSNRDSSAEKHLMKAVDYGSENPETYASLGNLYMFRKKYAVASKWYDEAIKKDTADPAYPYAKGMMFYQQNKYPEALKWFDRSLELDPYYVKSLVQLYTYYADIRRNQEKANAYNNVILQTDSLHPLGRFHIASQLQEKAFAAGAKNGNSAEYEKLMMSAIEEYSKALIRNPAYVQALYNRGYGYYALGMYDEALRDFESVLNADQYHARSYFMIASIYEYRKDLENAKKFYEIALQLQPDFSEAEKAISEISAALDRK